jgi:hypothetical protein
MAEYRHVGTRLLLHQDGKTSTITRYGQSIDLSPEQVAELRKQKVSILDASAFQSLGHSDEELTRWASSATWNNAPKPFLERVAKAHELAWQAIQDALATVPAQPPAAPAEPQPVPVTDQEGQ